MGEYVLLGSRSIPELEAYTRGCGDAAHCVCGESQNAGLNG
jgi:hypothetical protein